MSTAPESVSDGGETEAAAWLDNISFCSGFCEWIDEDFSFDSLPADSQQPAESTRASAGEQPSAEESPAEIPIRGNRRSRIHAFFKRAWKAVKKPFLRCRRTRVESNPEPAPVPGPSGLQTEPDKEPGLLNWEPTSESLYSLYTLEELIGKGSFGKVFKAIRKSDGQEVAIKRLCRWNNSNYVEIPGCSTPLPTEVAMLLMLRRPPVSSHVIQMYEWFDRPKIFSLVLECPQPCMVLRKFINDSGGLIEPIACGLMRQLVLAVQHCIDHGVFHSDIHSDNVLVNTDTLELKLIDFGAAHLLESKGYDSWKYLGAVEYCPPEVLSQPRYYAVPANVWGLGISLYLMGNMRLPFSNVQQILKASPAPWRSSVSAACRDLTGKCLNPNPERRPTFEKILQHPWFKSRL